MKITTSIPNTAKLPDGYTAEQIANEHNPGVLFACSDYPEARFISTGTEYILVVGNNKIEFEYYDGYEGHIFFTIDEDLNMTFKQKK